ncbi:MAG: hypothetical protein ACQKBY_03345 [Verrucomicrobiales bacterium]
MKKLFLLLVLISAPLFGVTLDVVKVFHPISLHGTDSAEADESGEAVQVAVMSRPMALSGAFPEVLVDAVARSYRMEGSPNYAVKECNLFELCQITAGARLEEKELVVELNLEKFAIPEEVQLPARTVLATCIKAVQKTLWAYPMAEGESLKVRVLVTGTDEKNASLAELGLEFDLEG